MSAPTFVDTAREIATLAHAGQKRHGDLQEPYIHHCGRVAEPFDNWPEAQATAWLHDAIEDHPEKVNRRILLNAGIPGSVVKAVELLDKRGKPYGVYLMDIRNNEIALAVKLKDMRDNISDNPSDKQMIRYSASILFLMDRISQSMLDVVYEPVGWTRP